MFHITQEYYDSKHKDSIKLNKVLMNLKNQEDKDFVTELFNKVYRAEAEFMRSEMGHLGSIIYKEEKKIFDGEK